MYKIKISRHNGITNTFNGILDNGQLRDCSADIPEEHYRAIEQDASASENMEGTLEIDGVFYGWVLSAMHKVKIIDPATWVELEFRDGLIVWEKGSFDLEHIFRGVDIAAIDAMTSDEVHSLVLSVWSKGYDGDPGNIQITVT